MIIMGQSQRRLVPQWRRFESDSASSEFAMPAGTNSKTADRGLDANFVKRLEHFRREPNLISAAEVVESAMVLGRASDGEVIRAARIIFRDSNSAPLVRLHATRLLNNAGDLNDQPNVALALSRTSKLRERIRANPLDAIAWVDLALTQTCSGQFEPAKRSMRVALNIAPTNRLVLRSAARLFFHFKDYEQAYDLVRRSEMTRVDPWLMAAEVSLSAFAEKKPRFVKQGLQLIESESLAPSQITELAGSIGTLMLVDDGGRIGRKLMRQSQMAPTVNAIAQADWISLFVNSGVSLASADQRTSQKAWEALALRAFSLEGEIAESIRYGKLWVDDEPYNPVAFASVAGAANVIEDFAIAREYSKRGLLSSRNDPRLLNAMSFAVASIGDLDGAEAYAAKVPEDGAHSLVATANRGLIAMRRGDMAKGKDLYRDAIAGFRRLGAKEPEVSCLLYFSAELARAGDAVEGRKRLEEAKEQGKVPKRKYHDFLAKRVEGQIQALERSEPREAVKTTNAAIDQQR